MEPSDPSKPTAVPKATDYNTRVCLLYDFRTGLSAADSVRKIHAIFGADAVGLEGAKTWWKVRPVEDDETTWEDSKEEATDESSKARMTEDDSEQWEEEEEEEEAEESELDDSDKENVNDDEEAATCTEDEW
ncbi:hypothetical protein M3Y99_00446500 [Aphelenchoides fujianensis]|nr:hypothetical protein M3Y99_00446500 [Aphelenchoides fujianensis]